MRSILALTLLAMAGCASSPMDNLARNFASKDQCYAAFLPLDHDVVSAANCLQAWDRTHGVPAPEQYQQGTGISVYGPNGDLAITGGMTQDGNIVVKDLQ